jgi:hypothetical protein
LPAIAFAFDCLRPRFGSEKGWDEQRGQDSDDGNHNQQLEESKRAQFRASGPTRVGIFENGHVNGNGLISLIRLHPQYRCAFETWSQSTRVSIAPSPRIQTD